jgi:hypothetical protein
VSQRNAFLIALGGRCVHCGRTNLSVLEIHCITDDHKGYGNKQRLADIQEYARSRYIPPGRILFCFDCHHLGEHGSAASKVKLHRMEEIRKLNKDVQRVTRKRTSVDLNLLTAEEKRVFEQDVAVYLETYPYLEEPFMMDLLYEYEFMKINLMRIRRVVFDGNIDEKEKYSQEKRADTLRRTMSLYANRMGITYVSRQRKKEKVERKTPLEMIEEEDEK